MIFQVFPSGPFSTNAYVAACAQTKEAAIIDPSPDSFPKIRQFLIDQKLKAIKILLTHSHWDHIADVKRFQNEYQIPVFVHLSDAPNLERPGADGLPCWLDIPPIKADLLIEEGTVIVVGGLSFQVLHTPGHSPGSVCYYEPKSGILFSGDTLFKGTIGNLSFPNSCPSSMWPSLNKLARLPPMTRVFPGHGEATTIEAESNWLSDAKKIFS